MTLVRYFSTLDVHSSLFVYKSGSLFLRNGMKRREAQLSWNSWNREQTAMYPSFEQKERKRCAHRSSIPLYFIHFPFWTLLWFFCLVLQRQREIEGKANQRKRKKRQDDDRWKKRKNGSETNSTVNENEGAVEEDEELNEQKIEKRRKETQTTVETEMRHPTKNKEHLSDSTRKTWQKWVKKRGSKEYRWTRLHWRLQTRFKGNISKHPKRSEERHFKKREEDKRHFSCDFTEENTKKERRTEVKKTGMRHCEATKLRRAQIQITSLLDFLRENKIRETTTD
jgi:hypothetical protein